MPAKIMVYGADEFLGRRIVEEAVGDDGGDASTGTACDVVVAGCRADRLALLAKRFGLEARRFRADEPNAIAQQLVGIDVLVNAATPSAQTTLPLAQAGLRAGCHVVDLNAESDVFRSLDPIGATADLAQRAVVRSAGAAASELMVDAAMRTLLGSGALDARCLGAVRIGMVCVSDFARASAESAWRALSRDVTVVRTVTVARPGGAVLEMRCDHEPIGRLERAFDFAVADAATPVAADARVCTAASLVDTLAAARSVQRHGHLASTVESYVAAGRPERLAYAAASRSLTMLAPLAGMRWSRALQRTAFLAWPDGPTDHDRRHEPHVIALVIEDGERTVLVDWRLWTPNFYDVGARSALAIAEALAGSAFVGLLAPAEVLDCDLAATPPVRGTALRGCRLDARVTA